MTSFERSVAFWLRAYPRRWRAVRAAEISAVLADLAETGARRLDPASAFELVRGGWATRWRGHPPLHVYLAYRMFDMRIPVRWRDWARDDIEGPWYPVRNALGLAWLVWGFGAFTNPAWATVAATVLLVALSVVIRGWKRAQVTRRHLALRPGELVVPGALVAGLARRRRLEARSAVSAIHVVLAVSAVAGVAAAWIRPPLLVTSPCWPGGSALGCMSVQPAVLVPPRSLVLVGVVAAATVGLALVPLVRSRLRRLVADHPAQPNRELVSTGPVSAAVRGVAAVAVVLVMMSLFSSIVIVFGEESFVAAVTDALTSVLGPIALLVLPAVVAVDRVLRRSGAHADGLSVSDVRTMVLRGRTPKVDELRPGLVCVDELWARYALTSTTGPETSGLEHPTLGPA